MTENPPSGLLVTLREMSYTSYVYYLYWMVSNTIRTDSPIPSQVLQHGDNSTRREKEKYNMKNLLLVLHGGCEFLPPQYEV